MKLKQLLLEREQIWVTPTNNKITTYFETGQGSKYILSEKNESKRNKSNHSNTGGEDSGLKGWYDNCFFVDDEWKYQANAPQFGLSAIGLKNIQVSFGGGKLAFYHVNTKTQPQRLLKFQDAYPKSGANESPLAFAYIEKPTIGYSVVEFTLNSDNSIKSWHFGSEVSFVAPISAELMKKFSGQPT